MLEERKKQTTAAIQAFKRQTLVVAHSFKTGRSRHSFTAKNYPTDVTPGFGQLCIRRGPGYAGTAQLQRETLG